MILGSRLLAVQQGKSSAHAENFWLDVIPGVVQKVDYVLVASIGGMPGNCAKTSRVKIMTKFPFPLQILYSGGGQGNEYFESKYSVKTLLFGGAYGWIRELARSHAIDVIHTVENYGPIQTVLSQIKAVKTTYQLTYDPRYPCYDQFLRLSLKPFDAVITGSQAIAQRLRDLQISPAAVKVIPWAVSPHSKWESCNEVRSRLGLRQGMIVVLWTGYIGTIVREQELLFSLQVARRILDELSNVVFIFAFKRQYFRRDHLQFETQRLKVLPLSSRTEFLDVAAASDLLLTPCLNREAIISPPLTWLECMSLGVPVVTTRIRGVEEVISNEEDGLIVSNPDETTAALSQLLRDPMRIARLGKGAKEKFRKKFQLNRASSAYLALWSSLCSARSG